MDVEELSARLQELAEASDFSDSQEGANDYGMPIVAAYSEANGGETEEDEEDDEALQVISNLLFPSMPRSPAVIRQNGGDRVIS